MTILKVNKSIMRDVRSIYSISQFNVYIYTVVVLITKSIINLLFSNLVSTTMTFHLGSSSLFKKAKKLNHDIIKNNN